MNFAEMAFLGCFIKANYLIKDTVIHPEQLEGATHKVLMQRMLDFSNAGKSIDLISLTTMPDLENFGGMSYLSSLLSHADVEKFEEFETLILELWKEREKKNILTLASHGDWEITRVIAELDKINEVKMNDHTPLNQALVQMYEAPWQQQEVIKKGHIRYS